MLTQSCLSICPSCQVSLASFGLGGLGNGIGGFGGLGGGLPTAMGGGGMGAAGLLHPMTPSAALSASSSSTQLSRTRLFVVVHKVRKGCWEEAGLKQLVAPPGRPGAHACLPLRRGGAGLGHTRACP